MKNDFFTLLVRGLVLCLVLQAYMPATQAQSSYHKKYEQALELIGREHWQDAKSILKDLSLVNEEPKLVPNILYFLSLSHFKSNELLQAQVAANKLVDEHTEWPYWAEAMLLKGEIEYARGKYSTAWKTLDALYKTHADIRRAVEALHQKYLMPAPKDSLNALYAKNSTNHILQYLVAARKGKNILVNAPGEAPKATYKRDTLWVALVMPFNLDHADPAKPTSYNTSVFDFYNGVNLAFKQLLADSLALKLYVYDNKKKVTELQRLLQLPEMQAMDLIIGPGFAEGLLLLQEFANKHKIHTLNPLNTPKNMPPLNQYYFSIIPTHASAAGSVFKIVNNKKWVNRAAIIYGVNKKDSLFAEAYRHEVVSQQGTTPVFRKVGKNTAANLSKYLLPMMDDTTGYILVPNDVDVVKTQLLASYDYLKLRQPIIIYGDWLDVPNADFESYNNRNIYFTDPDFYDKYSEAASKFITEYTREFGFLPSFFAWRGYEICKVFCPISLQYRQQLTDVLRQGTFINGIFSAGFQFNQSGENIFHPLLKLENLQIKNLLLDTE